ncbi:lipoyl(octanoyl) transferase LipB [Arthrobacter sp. zg-Y820]|uniref:lipoyl(octanoyl) transferase LipB n=1 Tax=unclassified Arthrobacter TaxID=235627 RepID=UPI001E6331C4|nr:MULTISPECIES: lipoyl(octanoyl) transferase LipB [unclassified Arthrobacter]MCC9197827.1 lipoyl(octanoyl) transferase LipB [Arthrobacter sp. zg-Y820]MDK1280694.1 lipoyl(octanoyl) transferase LipB [Arthrobacter sp. zg.Y820]MDK1360963.1 lipoyl(octanoyl) transferase LipB [Arthrobacter sp. zg-Y1219]WIB10673.1 lipoyl(octanoyl) transferase LipB [Arthrobacter sp. zg-Y820]
MTLEFLRIGLAPHYVEYRDGWDRQRALHERVRAGTAPDTVLLLEHSPVYTAGRRTEDHERPFDGTPVIPVDRGGKLTWHGPGQLVGYPILRLPDPSKVANYVDTLEAALISVLADYGVAGERVAGRSGVWVRGGGSDRKIAAIGIRVDHGVTMHGFALNCSNDLAPYGQIVACGIADAGTTTLSAETGRTVTPTDLVARVEEELLRRRDHLVREHPVGTTDTATPETGATAAGRPKGAML